MFVLEPTVGLEPTASRLQSEASTIEVMPALVIVLFHPSSAKLIETIVQI